MSDESFDEFMGHVKQGAIEVGTDIFNAAANLFSELLEPSDSSSIDYELSPSYVSEYDGLTIMVTGRHTIILDKQGNTLQKIDENLFRLNDNINLRITDGGITVLENSYSDFEPVYGDNYDLIMDTASPIMVYGLLFTCLISLMILFGIMVKRRRMMMNRRYQLARNSLATAADFAVVDSVMPPTAAQKKNVNDAPPSYETVTEQDKMLPKYEEV